jgi:methyl-accepting chemotaxis protein
MTATLTSAPKANSSNSKSKTAKFDIQAAMLWNAPVNAMFADMDFVIQYVNKSSIETLRTVEHLLPIRVDDLVGTCIDVFHKDPSRIRVLLSNPANLPHQAVIPLGPEKLDLRADAVRDDDGEVVGFILTWSVATKQLEELANFKGQVESISRAQAVIDFDMDGTILSANENFQNALGYTLAEIQGQHHRMFVDPAYAASSEYREMWDKLARGEFVSGEFKRIGKGGKEIWIQATYNPILDERGKPFKVTKFASDVTDQVKMREEMQNILNLVNQNASTLGSSAEELYAVSTQMAGNADETSSQANVVSAAAEQVSKNVQTVSTGVDELTSAIREIAKNASDSSRVADQAVTDAQKANETVTKLGDSSVEIGKVIKVITSIAEQTNLLALNATIEAARAGEAGKGFAVVANEVKELAKETARATEDISRKIETIQGDTTDAVSSIRQISEVISQINDISNTIASAVEEQAATASEMSRNVGEAAKGTSEIAQNITSVAQGAQSTSQGATNCQEAASELARMAAELQNLGAGNSKQG